MRSRRWPTGKYSVPVLWDKKKSIIVNNESSEILRMINAVRGGDCCLTAG